MAEGEGVAPGAEAGLAEGGGVAPGAPQAPAVMDAVMQTRDSVSGVEILAILQKLQTIQLETSPVSLPPTPTK